MIPNDTVPNWWCSGGNINVGPLIEDRFIGNLRELPENKIDLRTILHNLVFGLTSYGLSVNDVMQI